MICILKNDENGNISGWIIASSMTDALQRSQHAFENGLVDYLYKMEKLADSPPGKYKLPITTTDGSTYTMLVQK